MSLESSTLLDPPTLGTVHGIDSPIDCSLLKKRRSMSSLPSLFAYLDEDPITAPIFDQLVIVGASPLISPTETPTPICLLVHPVHPLIIPGPNFAQIPLFCFPNGFAKASDTRGTECVRDNFIFEIGSDLERRVYGICVIFSFANCKSSFIFNELNQQYPFCFCYLSRVLVPSAQFRYLDFLGKWISGQLLSLAMRRFEPVPPTASAHIPGMVKAGQAFRSEGFKIPRIFNYEISYARTIQPGLTSDSPFRLSKEKEIWIPAQETLPNCLPYFALDILFSVLPVRAIVRLVSIVLLQKRIAFLGNSLRTLSLSVICLGELIHPFKFVGTFLPVLPLTDDYLPMLDSPTPFVFGIPKSGKQPPIPPDVVTVDLDRGEIHDPDASPLLAGSDQLVSMIDAILELHRAEIELPPRFIGGKGTPVIQNPDFLEFIKRRRHGFSRPFSYGTAETRYFFERSIVEQIVNLFKIHIAPMLEVVMKPCFVTDATNPDQPVTVFHRELFLGSLPPANRDFYEAFMTTTMFQQYLEGMMETNAREVPPFSRGSGSPLLSDIERFYGTPGAIEEDELCSS